jgi:hypothetical protein
MAETDPKVMSLVETALVENPAVSVQELYDMAKRTKRSIKQMTLRQFHARYPLQIKRKKGNSARKRARKAGRSVGVTTRSAGTRSARAAGGVDRDAVRTALLGFASDLAAADSRSEAVNVVASVDKYVAQIERAIH